jgi:hypothetical protein
VLPQNFEPLSPLYTVDVNGDSVRVAIAAPNGADPAYLVDVYTWDETNGKWAFVPSAYNPNNATFTFTVQDPGTWLVGKAQPTSAQIGVDAADAPADFAIADGVTIGEGGQVSGPPSLDSGALLVDGRAWTNYTSAADVVGQIADLNTGYDRVLLHLAPGSGLTDFVLAVREVSPALTVIVDGTQLEAYDFAGLRDAEVSVWMAPGLDPTVYYSGAIVDMMDTFTGEVPREMAGLFVNAESVDIGQTATPVDFDALKNAFGQVAPIEGYAVDNTPLAVGQGFAARLDGSVTSMGVDTSLGMNYLTYVGDGSEHIIYLTSPTSLLERMSWANRYGVNTVAISGYEPAFATALTDETVAEAGEELQLSWVVTDSEGTTVTEETGDLTLLQYLWQSITEPGTYTMEASVQRGSESTKLGAVAFEVAEQTDEPTPTPTPPPADNDEQADAGDDSDSPPTPPPPVTGSVASGSWELGGQTHSLANPDRMRQAGMTWVKFQHKWSPGQSPNEVAGRIDSARANGFKVLLSIPGPLYPDSIEYGAYIEFLRGVAALGPDAIEIWNEMNFDVEWPADDINGASYVTNMLAPAYNAIKSTNPNVMVIGGAPTPTGAFGGGCGTLDFGNGNSITGCDDWVYLQQMADAGAANYMDCMGMHYNEGILPPSQTSGDPRGEFYSYYLQNMTNLYYNTIGKPVCITELGYLSPEGLGELPGAFAWASNTTAAQQAAWQAEAAIIASQSGKVRMSIIWNVDIFVWGSDPQAGFAIIRPDGSCPACESLAQVMGQ